MTCASSFGWRNLTWPKPSPWLSPSTVRKHLENTYGKLGVRTRTAAVARLRGH